MSAALLMLADFADTIDPAKHSEGNWPDSVIGHAAIAGIFPGLALSDGAHRIPIYNGQSCYGALSDLFRIGEPHARFLFSHGAYQGKLPKPKDVAARLRRFVEGVQM